MIQITNKYLRFPHRMVILDAELGTVDDFLRFSRGTHHANREEENHAARHVDHFHGGFALRQSSSSKPTLNAKDKGYEQQNRQTGSEARTGMGQDVP